MRQLKISKQITDRSSMTLDKYLEDIKRIPLLSIQKEEELCDKIKQGDQKALEQLVRANLRFVISVAKQYKNNNIELIDLINEGNLGLIKAAKVFDNTKGTKFISYAVWHIRDMIIKSLCNDSRIVRMPFNKSTKIKSVNDNFSYLEQELKREPSIEELSEHMGCKTRDLEYIFKLPNTHTSLDAPLSNDEDCHSLSETIPSDNNTFSTSITDSLKIDINVILSNLPDRESNIIQLYYGINVPSSLTFDEIAEKYDICRERVRQICDAGLFRIRRNKVAKEKLMEYLG